MYVRILDRTSTLELHKLYNANMSDFTLCIRMNYTNPAMVEDGQRR